MAHFNLISVSSNWGQDTQTLWVASSQTNWPRKSKTTSYQAGLEQGTGGCPHLSWTSNIPVLPLCLFPPASPFFVCEEGLGHLGHFCCLGCSVDRTEGWEVWAGHEFPMWPSPRPFLQHFRVAPVMGAGVLLRELICEKELHWFEVGVVIILPFSFSSTQSRFIFSLPTINKDKMSIGLNNV